jgi:molybdopterin molybdotransferase
MLQNALINLGFEDVSIHKIEDNHEATYNKLQDVIVKNDMVIISGGISVGDCDFVGKALKEIHIEEVFYKVNQKPGKPLFFGKNEDTLLFALPGNPAAALTCFYMYVYTALQKMSGSKDVTLPKVMAKSTSSFAKNGTRPQILKAIYKEGEVSILEGQSSAMLQTFSISNALVKMPEDLKQIDIKDIIEVILLPV